MSLPGFRILLIMSLPVILFKFLYFLSHKEDSKCSKNLNTVFGFYKMPINAVVVNVVPILYYSND